MVLPRWVWDYVRVTMEGGSYAEVRGWFRDAVAPRHSVRPTVSEVTSPCPTKRDVYLRRVVKVSVSSNESLVVGKLVHEVFLAPFRYGFSSFSELDSLFNKVIGGYGDVGARYRDALYGVFMKAVGLALQAREEGVPVSVEPLIPGALIGFSDFVRPDLLVGFIPVEIVSSLPGNDDSSMGRKDLAIAAYALAVEAWVGHPVDIGVMLHIGVNGGVRFVWRVVRVDDGLRRAVLDLRDYVARIIEHGDDPGVAGNCPRTCPFYGVCHG
jgi:CRISPR-associated protein Csa1